MSEPKKIDTKKLLIILIPLVMGLVIYTFFFKNNVGSKQTPKSESMLVPDSKTENLPGKKSEIYSQEKRSKLAKLREEEKSNISSQAFFNAVTKDEDAAAAELAKLSEEEKIKKLAQTFPDATGTNNTHRLKNNAFLLEEPASKDKWKASKVENELEQYDYEKKSEPKRTPVNNNSFNLPNGKEPEPIPTVNVKKEVVTIPGKRSRNNTLSSEAMEIDGNLIPAAIHGDQTITNGATVKMRLLQDIFIEGQRIPKNTFIHGIARFNSERVNIQLKAIRLENSQIKFTKTIIDKDGIEGLFFPDNLGNEMKKEIGGDALDEAYDIATAGTGTVGSIFKAGKSVLKRRNVERKVTLKSNYNIYLK